MNTAATHTQIIVAMLSTATALYAAAVVTALTI